VVHRGGDFNLTYLLGERFGEAHLCFIRASWISLLLVALLLGRFLMILLCSLGLIVFSFPMTGKSGFPWFL